LSIRNRVVFAPAVGGLFFPLAGELKRPPRELVTPSVMQKAVWAGTHQPSFDMAAESVGVLGEVPLSAKQIRRITTIIGEDRVAERRGFVEDFLNKTLVERTSPKPGVQPPDVGVLMLDNGTHQRRDHFGEKGRKTHWKQETGGLALSMTSEVHEADPCPEFPEWLFQADVVAEIANLAQRGETLENQGDAREDDVLLDTQERLGFEWTPKLVSREVIASTAGTDVGAHLEWVAWEHGITQAKRQAFVSDGAAGIWAIHKKHFSQMTPILDLMHALSYAHRAAAGINEPTLYRRWAQAIWQGRVADVIAELEEHQTRLGPPPTDASADDPRQRIHRAWTYYTNNQSRMNYPEYRRLGLPITSSLMESAIKQLSRRIKGTEKFWLKGTADAILQLRADFLSDSNPLQAFWERWQEKITGANCYRMNI
jgi:hypothetical protein